MTAERPRRHGIWYNADMKTKMCVCAFAVISIFAVSAAGWGPNDCIDGRCDRESPVYGPGEEMTFTFKLRGFDGLDASAHVFDWKRTGDDGLKESGKAPADRPLVLKTSLDRPGFIRYYIELKDASGNVVKRVSQRAVFFDGGAGVDIFAIRTAVPEPEDFDAFWARHKATLANVEWKGREKVVQRDSDNPNVDVYTVETPCAGGMPMTGFLYVPSAAKKGGKFPAAVEFNGYGASWGVTTPRAKGRKADEIAFNCSAHGFELMREPQYYKDFRAKVAVNGYSYAFDPKTNSDPETAYFCGMSYRVMRALEFVKSRPEWDGKTLVVRGGSMGGMQSIWAAALDHDVTQVKVFIPWCCDIGGETIGRNRGGWYVKWAPPGLGYYDTANMARRMSPKAEFVMHSFGLGDYICPPTGVMAMYNNVPCEKKSAVGNQNAQHDYTMPNPRQTLKIVGAKVVSSVQ